MIKDRFVNFMAALLVKIAAYFAISLFYVLLLMWADIINNFSWKYVIALTIVLLGIRIFIAEIFIKSEKSGLKRKK